LITHVVLSLKKERGVVRRIGICTLGSPLGAVSAVFPTVVYSPQKLLRMFRSRWRISRWWNAWHDGDVVGRRLLRTERRGVTEISLGPGRHGGYLADPMVWRLVAAIVRSEVVSQEGMRSRGWNRPTPRSAEPTARKRLASATWALVLAPFVLAPVFLMARPAPYEFGRHWWLWSWLAIFELTASVGIGYALWSVAQARLSLVRSGRDEGAVLDLCRARVRIGLVVLAAGWCLGMVISLYIAPPEWVHLLTSRAPPVRGR
jgi:hypothetical protein